VAELKATFERILNVAASQAEAAPLSMRHARADEAPRSADPTSPAALKRLLQLRAHRRRTAIGEIFEWPAWDMLLDLAAVRAEGGHVSVSSLCVSSGAPQSTALRKLDALEKAKLVRRYFHGSDRRRVCVALTDDAAEIVREALQEEAALHRGISSAN
jgi:DNA-binding transcriptional ArsR family regulator